MASISKMMDVHLGNLKYDKKLFRKIRAFRMAYLTKTSSHVSFFSNGITGTVRIPFKSNYVTDFFMDITDADPVQIVNDYPKAPVINPKFKISGDPFNLTLYFMAHKFLKLGKLGKSGNKKAAKECILIFNYRTISAIVSKRFTYLANTEIAMAVYESMSNRFILKQKGNWASYLEYRADKLLDSKSPYLKYLTTMKNDKDFINTINEGSSAIRSTFNIIYGRHLEITESGDYVRGGGIISPFDDDDMAEISSKLVTGIRLCKSDVRQEATFVITDLVTLTGSVVPEYASANLKYYLKGLVNYANTVKGGMIVDTLIEDILTFLYDKLAKSNFTERERNNAAVTIQVAKTALYATRTTEDLLIKIKDDSAKITMAIRPIGGNQSLTSMKHALCLYIFLYSILLR